MDAKKKKALIFGGIALGIGAYIIYVRKRNEKEAAALLSYISQMSSQVDKSAAAEQAIKTVEATKFDPDRLHVVDASGRKLYGKYSDPRIKNAVSEIALNLNKAMSGLGTDTTSFYKNFSRIRNKNTMGFINTIYKSLYGKTLFERMKEEDKLHNTSFGVFSDKTKYDMNIPLLSDGYWNPNISKYLTSISLYN